MLTRKGKLGDARERTVQALEVAHATPGRVAVLDAEATVVVLI